MRTPHLSPSSCLGFCLFFKTSDSLSRWLELAGLYQRYVMKNDCSVLARGTRDSGSDAVPRLVKRFPVSVSRNQLTVCQLNFYVKITESDRFMIHNESLGTLIKRCCLPLVTSVAGTVYFCTAATLPVRGRLRRSFIVIVVIVPLTRQLPHNPLIQLASRHRRHSSLRCISRLVVPRVINVQNTILS